MFSAVPHSNAGGLSALAYGSVVGPSLHDPLRLAEIVAEIRPANTDLAVTVAIVCDARRIQQWIEGPDAAVALLWDRIHLDPRHRLHWATPPAVVTTRHFPGSPMKLAMTTASLARLDPCLIGDLVTLPDTAVPSRQSLWSGFAIPADGPETGAPAFKFDPAQQAQACRLANTRAAALADMLTDSDPALARNHLDSVLYQTRLPEMAVLVQAVLDHLQAGWMAGLVTTLQRQLAVTMLQSALRLWLDVAESTNPVGCALVSVLPGTPDMCGAMLKVALLRRAGWSVRLLLPQTTTEIREAAESLQPDLIVLAGSRLSVRQEDSVLLADLLPALARTSPAPIILGGKLADTDPRAFLRQGASAVCSAIAWVATIAADLVPMPDPLLACSLRDNPSRRAHAGKT